MSLPSTAPLIPVELQQVLPWFDPGVKIRVRINELTHLAPRLIVLPPQGSEIADLGPPLN